MTEDNNPSKRKLEESLRDEGIEPSIRDIGNGTMGSHGVSPLVSYKRTAPLLQELDKRVTDVRG